nr:hypothetical protein [Tanacetum cinerariifolium]
MEAEDQEIIKSINETHAQKAAKRRKLSEEAQEAEDLRKRLEVRCRNRCRRCCVVGIVVEDV